MVNDKVVKLMDFGTREFKKMQHDALKEHVLDVLGRLMNTIKLENYDDVADYYTFSSPSGDCMGLDNEVINFAYRNGERKDIVEVIAELEMLKSAFEEKDEDFGW